MIRASDHLSTSSQNADPTADTADGQEPSGVSSGQRAPRTSFIAKHQTLINFWLDTALLLNFVVLIWVSVVVHFIFPPAESAAGYLLWKLTLSQFMNWQFATLACFCLGVVFHLMMHWSWVCGVVGSRFLRKRDGSRALADDGERTIFGVGMMIVLLNLMGLGIAIAALSIRAPL